MALQDICDFQDIFLDRVPTQCSSLPFGKKNGFNYLRGLPFSNSTSLFNFYIPVAEYLDKSPIQFGQIDPIQSSSTPLSQDCNLPSLSLPVNSLPSSTQSVPLPFPISHGTTTLAFIFQGGVLAAADTRSSCSGKVEGPASQKILPIHSHMVSTTSGTSADCTLWKRILSRELRLYQLRHGRQLSTSGAAKLLSHMLHPFKGTELCVAAIMCGWDGGEVHGHHDNGGTNTDPGGCTETKKKEKSVDPSLEKTQSSFSSAGSQQHLAREKTNVSGPRVFYVCSDGTRLQGSLFSVGSGSPYAYSVLDQGVKWELTLDEATSIAREAVYRATHRDAYSGNNVDIYHLSSKGWIRRNREDLKEEYYREKERRERGMRQIVTLSEENMKQTNMA
ncbi:proteasome subunit beta type-11-like [Paralichthys olivaceus]|uniref:proteasome subunit beta type-11-like n=1 Tax=Paralichthys olivaceus TaxID=8255 RepID=UPI00375300CB